MPRTAFFVDLRQKGLHRFLASGVSFKDGDSGMIESYFTGNSVPSQFDSGA
jgi:hypothetical protein